MALWQVYGRVVNLHPDLANGPVLAKNVVKLLRCDVKGKVANEQDPTENEKMKRRF